MPEGTTLEKPQISDPFSSNPENMCHAICDDIHRHRLCDGKVSTKKICKGGCKNICIVCRGLMGTMTSCPECEKLHK